MKKLILCAVLCLSLLGFAAVAEQDASPVFAAGEPHRSILTYKHYFKTMCCDVQQNCHLAIQEQIFDEASAAELYQLVSDDLTAVSDWLGMESSQYAEHTIYVVDTLMNGVIERQGNHVYCQAEHIRNGAYRPLLISALLGTEEYWVGTGLADCIFGEIDTTDDLQTYYSTVDDLSLLSLDPPFFMSEFNSAGDIAVAKKTAASLCAYIVAEYGVAALQSGIGEAERTGWLASNGVEKEYADPYADILQGYRYIASKQYAFIASTDQHEIYVTPMEDMTHATDVRRFLYEIVAEPAALFELIEQEAPDFTVPIQNRYGRLRIYCGEESSYAIPEYKEIRLLFSSGYLHELGHILVPPVLANGRYSSMWQYEGLSNYFYWYAAPSYAQKVQYGKALRFFAELTAPETPNHRYMKRSAELYLQGAPMPASPDEVSVDRYVEAMAVTPYLYPDDAADAAWALPVSTFYPQLQNENGNELTGEQAYSFAKYLIRTYSLNDYLRYCCEGCSFEEAFGTTYDAARDAWIQQLMDRFR